MRRDSFPTFRRIGRWLIKIAKIPAVQKTCFAIGGFFVMWFGMWFGAYFINCLVPPRYYLDPLHLYIWSLAGFAGALAGAWGLKSGWGGPAYGATLGLLVGSFLFWFDGGIAWTWGPGGGHDAPMGDRIAGLLFFFLTTVGGCVGTRLAGVSMPFLRGPLTRKRILLWLLAIALIIGFWLALYYKWQLEFYRGAP